MPVGCSGERVPAIQWNTAVSLCAAPQTRELVRIVALAILAQLAIVVAIAMRKVGKKQK